MDQSNSANAEIIIENRDFTVWVFNKPSELYTKFVYDSILESGISRFGWSFLPDADLNQLKEMGPSTLEGERLKIWNKTNFLLNVKPGDWIVHINVPYYGRCIAAKVTEGYRFDEATNSIADYSSTGDFRHTIMVDEGTIQEFDRNDINVLPVISRRLKLQGHYWRIQQKDEFISTLQNLKARATTLKKNEQVGTYYLKDDLDKSILKVTQLIHAHFPGKKLEYFLEQIFKKIDNVVETRVNGSGPGTDYGADIIVKYNTGLNIANLAKVETLVVQVKSYSGTHSDLTALDQIVTGIKKFEADAGLLMSTGTPSKELIRRVEEMQNELNKPIGMIAGKDMAKFVLKYFGDELLFNV